MTGVIDKLHVAQAEQSHQAGCFSPNCIGDVYRRVHETSNKMSGNLGTLAGDATAADDAPGLASAPDVLDSMDVNSLATSLSKLSSCDSVVPDVATFGRRSRHKAFSR